MSTFHLSSRVRAGIAGSVACGIAFFAIPAFAASPTPTATPTPGAGTCAAFLAPAPSASPAAATPTSTPAAGSAASASAQLQQSCSKLKDVQTKTAALDTHLAEVQQQLASAQAQLNTVNAELVSLKAEVNTDSEKLQAVQAVEMRDSSSLSEALRQSYQQGDDGALEYMLGSSSFSSMMDRYASAERVQGALTGLTATVAAEKKTAEALLADAQAREKTVEEAQLQLTTLQTLVAQDEQRVAQADAMAHDALNTATTSLQDALAVAQAWGLAQDALASARLHGTIFPAVPGSNFTEDTDLTLPSGLTAAEIDTFLQGTALQGLGGAYFAAEQKYHVSARYLVAHSIEESAFGTSAIAQDKHNLFGYGANDANPYNDAKTFPSFAACIDFVAGIVAQNYLSPSGSYYHGPTLRGMNVDYATDPNWAVNITNIANTIPPATSPGTWPPLKP